MASKFNDRSHRFSVVANEPRTRVPLLRGFENMPLVTLNEAIRPLIPHVSEIQHMVYRVRSDNKEPADGLTTEESASIMLYSLEWIPSENSFYCILNSTLRSTNREALLPPWFSYLKLFMTALSKLRSILGNHVFRGVKMDLRGQYTVGSTCTWWGFSSCTSTVSVLENDQFFGQSGSRTLFSIQCDTGKSIINHSYYEGEDEILLLPGREFKVVGCLDMGNQLHMIQLKEIMPPFPPIASVSLAPRLVTPVELSFSSKGLTDAEMQRLMSDALIKQRCTSLSLSQNKITRQGASIISTAIENNEVRLRKVTHSAIIMREGQTMPRRRIVSQKSSPKSEKAHFIGKETSTNIRSD